jgi:hypothetical protein
MQLALVSQMFVETFRGAEENNWTLGNEDQAAETLNSHDAQFRHVDETPGEILSAAIARAPTSKNFPSGSWWLLLNRIYTRRKRMAHARTFTPRRSISGRSCTFKNLGKASGSGNCGPEN